MELVLAMDLRRNLVVHGKSGLRATYKPLDWGASPTAEPLGYVRALAPKFLYIADLDRIECTGCLLYTSPSPRDRQKSRMPSSA